MAQIPNPNHNPIVIIFLALMALIFPMNIPQSLGNSSFTFLVAKQSENAKSIIFSSLLNRNNIHTIIYYSTLNSLCQRKTPQKLIKSQTSAKC